MYKHKYDKFIKQYNDKLNEYENLLKEIQKIETDMDRIVCIHDNKKIERDKLFDVIKELKLLKTLHESNLYGLDLLSSYIKIEDVNLIIIEYCIIESFHLSMCNDIGHEINSNKYIFFKNNSKITIESLEINFVNYQFKDAYYEKYLFNNLIYRKTIHARDCLLCASIEDYENFEYLKTFFIISSTRILNSIIYYIDRN